MKIITASNGQKKVKISKKEWETIGKKAGWGRIAQEGTNSQQLIMMSAKFVTDIIQQAFSNNPKTPSDLRMGIYNVAKGMGLLKSGWNITFPENIDPSGELTLKIYPQSADGKTKAEVHGTTVHLYTDVIMANPQNSIQEVYGRLLHEFAHIHEEKGTSPDEEEENGGIRTVKYLTNNGEMNSNAWQIAGIYSQMFPGQPYNDVNIQQLANQYSTNNTIKAYLISFAKPDVQAKYQQVANLAQVYQTFIQKTKGYVDYIIQYQQQQVQQPQQAQPQQPQQAQPQQPQQAQPEQAQPPPIV